MAKKAAGNTATADAPEQTSHSIGNFPYDSKDANRAWANGYYKAAITEVDVTESKSGEPMCVIQFEVKSGEDKQLQREHIVAKNLFKLEALARAFDRSKDFYDHTFQPADHIGCELIVELKTESTPEFGSQNKIAGVRAASWVPGDKDLQTKIAPDLVAPLF